MKYTNKLSVIGGAFVVIILWLTFMLKVLPLLISGRDIFTGDFIYTPIGAFVFMCIVAPLWEEAVFRHASLQIARTFKDRGMDMTVPVCLLSSAIFGWGHGSGAISILIQGVIGMLLCYTYIKTNYNYWAAFFTHFLWNFSLGYIFPTLAGMYGIKIW